MRDNFVFLVIFDTCDVVYNWFISLLPPIVLYNLFVLNENPLSHKKTTSYDLSVLLINTM